LLLAVVLSCKAEDPTAVLELPVLRFKATYPIAVLLCVVIFDDKEPLPRAVLFPPEVSASKEFLPTAVLFVPEVNTVNVF
jgi:hypothetical protein